MTDSDIHEWLAPIDEALKPGRKRKPQGPLSLHRLADLGVDRAIAESRASQAPERTNTTEDIVRSLRAMDGKIRYRMSGGWLKSRGREQRFLRALRFPPPAIQALIDLVLEEAPAILLDVAAGGGSGVASLVDALRESATVFAVERDLKCLWTIQKKLQLMGEGDHCEAVGADVRRLPLAEDSVHVVSSTVVMHEVLGMEAFLGEIARVLRSGGCYCAVYFRKPRTHGLIPPEDMRRFAGAVGMYSGHEDLVPLAGELGLALEEHQRHVENGKDLAVSRFRKQ